MLRSLYSCALRLHPRAFRKRFADEMRSIFDHANGNAAKFTLFLDAVISLCRQWTLRPEFWHEASSAAPPPAASDGIPTFYTINPFRPRSAAFINGIVLSSAVFCVTCFAIRYSWIHVLHVHIPEVQFERPSWTPPSHTTSGVTARLEKPPVVRQPDNPKSLEGTISAAAPLAQAPPPAAMAHRRRSLRQLKAASTANDPQVSNGSFRAQGEIEPALHIYEGAYTAETPAKIMIVITTNPGDESLTMSMSGQPSFALLPLSETKFAVQSMDNCWIEFIPGDSASGSPMDELQFSCNGQKYIAHRR